ncbi:hypothetical protein KDL01_39515 [Actinospica durhamensis]|uniref:Uncharacterized protein n=1 Tax=Actinospica durhamensis TaxID=1508375 RepID=A0A941IS12_9ACTN|nr:hypothetical protein [Actinospica durhamensis]MBR7839415.1 hypothetical protein [Actinospica durhamensis]
MNIFEEVLDEWDLDERWRPMVERLAERTRRPGHQGEQLERCAIEAVVEEGNGQNAETPVLVWRDIKGGFTVGAVLTGDSIACGTLNGHCPDDLYGADLTWASYRLEAGESTAVFADFFADWLVNMSKVPARKILKRRRAFFKANMDRFRWENAFPVRVRGEVGPATTIMPAAAFRSDDRIITFAATERIAIPGRIYNPEPDPARESELTETQRTLLDCLYSRHADGWIRQRRIENVLRRPPQSWTVPFVVELAGEYVLEIVESIRSALAELDVSGSLQRAEYGRYVAGVPWHFKQVERRVISYWALYYRDAYPVYADYPGGALVESMRSAAFEFSGRRIPSTAPAGSRRR